MSENRSSEGSNGTTIPELGARLRSTVATGMDEDIVWDVVERGDGVRLRLPDREIHVEPRQGPGAETRWTTALSADGATVTKDGPFDSVEAALERVRRLLATEVRYTVCCDSEPDRSNR